MSRFRAALAFVMFASFATLARGQEYLPVPGKPIAFAKVVPQAGLPNVLIIGDSISIGYTPALRELLQGKANVYRIPVNGGPTSRGVESIDQWLGETHWDVIHFNWGLHDLKYVDSNGKAVEPAAGDYQVPPAQYEQNLRTLVARLQKTKAALIWRNTTPVPANSPYRIEGEERRYNEIAARIMHEQGIPTDDQHTFVMQHMAEVQRPANVHFTPEGSQKLAELAAAAIQQQLQKRQPANTP